MVTTSPWKSAWYTSSSRSSCTLGRGEAPVSFFSAPVSAAADAAISASRAFAVAVLDPGAVFSSSAAQPASRALPEGPVFVVAAVVVGVVVVGIGACVEVSSAARFFSSTWSGDDGAWGSWLGLASAAGSAAGGFEAAIGMCESAVTVSGRLFE